MPGIAFKPHNDSERRYYYPILQMRKWKQKLLSNLMKATQLVNGRAGIQIQVYLLAKHVYLTTTLNCLLSSKVALRSVFAGRYMTLTEGFRHPAHASPSTSSLCSSAEHPLCST